MAGHLAYVVGHPVNVLAYLIDCVHDVTFPHAHLQPAPTGQLDSLQEPPNAPPLGGHVFAFLGRHTATHTAAMDPERHEGTLKTIRYGFGTVASSEAIIKALGA